ncbi:unnamed protein product [Linum tenue]|uniref:Uncharacterized protein n=1 Tax=Linum tenue TaxID=586396 RepID=A0AAV0NP91_9ROSI|nr:unnamed protein product [Linum tenue]
MQNLEFDLTVYAPYRPVEGFIHDIEDSSHAAEDQIQMFKRQRRASQPSLILSLHSTEKAAPRLLLIHQWRPSFVSASSVCSPSQNHLLRQMDEQSW